MENTFGQVWEETQGQAIQGIPFFSPRTPLQQVGALGTRVGRGPPLAEPQVTHRSGGVGTAHGLGLRGLNQEIHVRGTALGQQEPLLSKIISNPAVLTEGSPQHVTSKVVDCAFSSVAAAAAAAASQRPLRRAWPRFPECPAARAPGRGRGEGGGAVAEARLG